MNVDLRVHLSFPLLLAFAMGYSVLSTGSATRGIALWLALCFAVFVREVARALAAAYAGLKLRAIFFMPVGGIMAFTLRNGATPSAPEVPVNRWVAAAGPVANLAVGLLLLAVSYLIDPRVSLLTPPWVTLGHLLRSLIWMQLILGAVSLIPTPAPPSRNLEMPTGKASPLSSLSPSTGIALIFIVAGCLIPQSYWLILIGGFMLLGAQLTNIQAAHSGDGDSILVRDVMLTEYTLLSSTDTLQGALTQTVHSLQDVFPVVRGNQLVGSIGRQTIASRLVANGDSYLQGAMTRSLPIAAPAEKLIDALRRASHLGASEFIPVIDDTGLVGILTPQSLTRAVHQVKLTRPTPNARERS